METIIATIKPQYARKIYSGEKLWELRKSAPKERRPFKVLLCESGTGGEITGGFVCDRVITANGDKLLRFLAEHERELGISLTEAIDYADGKPLFFWHVTAPREDDGDKVLTVQDYGIKRVPMSWERVK